MRLVQRPKDETPTLSLWLSREIPQERELANELLEGMGREKSLDYLLHLHDKEETRRQKLLRGYVIGMAAGLVGFVLVALALLYSVYYVPTGEAFLWLRGCIALGWLCLMFIHSLIFWAGRARSKKTPYFSSPVQQTLVTSLLDYGDNPLVADALCRATDYYTGDRKRLYERLAHILPLLPDAPDALTKPARRAIWNGLSPAVSRHYANDEEHFPALQKAIKHYFVRTGDQDLRFKIRPRVNEGQ